jgi:hypothetical protein
MNQKFKLSFAFIFGLIAVPEARSMNQSHILKFRNNRSRLSHKLN